MCQVIGLIRCTYLKIGPLLKMAHRRVKLTKILASGVCSMNVGIDLEHVKVIWGHSVHFSKNWAVTQKWLIIEGNGRLGLGGVCSMHVDIFDLECVKVIWSHSVHFSKIGV